MGSRAELIFLDTHVWLWWHADPHRLSPSATNAVRSATTIGISAISCLEVAMLASHGRISLDRSVADWVRQALAVERTRSLPVTAAIAVAASSLTDESIGGDPADRIIIATALHHDAVLVTKDRRIREFDATRTVWD